VADTRIEELRRRLERDPGSRLFAQLAEELRKAGELAEAIRIARAGLALHPAYPSARLTLGRALLDSGDATSARAELDSAARDAPDNIQASRYLAQAREQLGDLKGAAEQYRKTLQMAPDDRQLQGTLAAVEARLHAPGGAQGARPAAQAPPPATVRAPPPLPVGAASAPAAATATPPVVTAPPRLAALAEADREASLVGGALPPTLKISVSQAGTPAPQAPANRPLAPAPPELVEVIGPKTLPRSASIEEATVERGGMPASKPVAAPVAPPAQEAPREAGDPASVSTTPFSSSTLAELYFKQGLVDRAVEVYRQLVEQEPDNERARRRLGELEAAPRVGQDRAARRHTLERMIAALTTLLAAVRRR
jgi:tetratricopeptide (TPR) repeat protein